MWIVNFQMFKLTLEKAEETGDQIANIHWIIEKAMEDQKNIHFCFYWLHQSFWLCRSQQTVENSSREEYKTTWPASWEIWMQVRKEQLELDMEQQTSSK